MQEGKEYLKAFLETSSTPTQQARQQIVISFVRVLHFQDAFQVTFKWKSFESIKKCMKSDRSCFEPVQIVSKLI